MNKTFENLGYLIIIVLAWFFAVAYQAFVGNALWGWFVTPSFGVAAPGLLNMMGLWMLLRLGTVQFNATKTDNEAATTALIASTITLPTFTLAFGWLIVQFTGG